MSLIYNITPAETMMVLNPSSSSLKELMKYTFIDLILKKVIKITESSSLINKKHNISSAGISYVKIGKNFSSYRPKKHEFVFLTIFYKNRQLKVLFKQYMKVIYNGINSEYDYKSAIRTSPDINSLYTTNFFSKLLRRHVINEKGKLEQTKIYAVLKPIDNSIDSGLKDKESVQKMLSIGGNMFLLNNFSVELLSKIDSMFKDLEFNQTTKDSNWNYYFDIFEDQILFDSVYDSFDSSDSFFDTEFDAAGCSSCDSSSECSSCSGCGGCS
jgi:hypothetical protein